MHFLFVTHTKLPASCSGGLLNEINTKTAASSLFGTKVTFSGTQTFRGEGENTNPNIEGHQDLPQHQHQHQHQHKHQHQHQTQHPLAPTDIDPTSLSLLAIQGMFRRQLQTVERSVAAAKAQHVAGINRYTTSSMGLMGRTTLGNNMTPFDYTSVLNPNVGANVGVSETATETPTSTRTPTSKTTTPTPRKSAKETPRSSKSSTDAKSSSKTKSNFDSTTISSAMRSKKKSRSKIKRDKPLEYWQALQRVDSSLTKREAKRIAKMQNM